ncbi:MAG: EAL domain-containing protein [Methylobacterium mesophilicum]|nr:EAL domain-containing protein [Methylobacterium mesophilicum]
MPQASSSDLMYRLLVQGVKDYAIYLLDGDGRVMNWNAGAERAKGYKAAEIVGCNYASFFTEGDRAKGLPARNLATARRTGHFSGEGWRIRKNGERFWASVAIDAVHDEAGEFVGFAKITRDLSEQRDAERRLVHVANHDPLTGLANRAFFNRTLEDQLPQIFYGASMAVHYIDLDRFKPVNDTFGHGAGDDLLEQVARRIEALVEPGDVIARLGGDEFALMQLSAGTRDAAANMASRIVAELGRPFRVGKSRVSVGATIGIAMVPESGHSANEALRNADLALYEAKQQGRGRFCFYDEEIGQRALAKRVLELRLRHAVATESFALHYQPIVDGGSERIVAFEALLRWKDQGGDFVSPNEFIPFAENLGLMSEIGAWVLRAACRDAAGWPEHIAVSVNISATQLRDRAFVETVSHALLQSGLAASRLELELTETAILSDIESAAEILGQLRRMGVMIALDDFGTGFSSLSLVERLPLTRLKIDQSFVQQMDGSKRSAAVIRAVTSLCKGFGLATTAEGVETSEQRALLVNEGCEGLQGYFFGRPMPGGAVMDLLGMEIGEMRAAG